MQPMESGWAAIGVVIKFVPLQEVRVSHSGFGINGEIGEDMAALHKASEKDEWEILYGNGDIVVMDVGGIIAGLTLYQRAKSTADQRLLHHLTDKMLKLNEAPPHMKKAIIKSTAMGSLEMNPTKRVGRLSSSHHAANTNGSNSSSSSSSSSFPGAVNGPTNMGEQDDTEDAPIAYTCMVCGRCTQKMMLLFYPISHPRIYTITITHLLLYPITHPFMYPTTTTGMWRSRRQRHDCRMQLVQRWMPLGMRTTEIASGSLH